MKSRATTTTTTTSSRHKKSLHTSSQQQSSSSSSSLLSPRGGTKVTTKSATEEARSITQSLRRTQTLLAQELERVSHVTDVIDHDGQLLERTATHHHQLKHTVHDAGSALRMLKYQQRKAAIIWWTSIAVYSIVFLYVMWARIRIPFVLW